MRPYTQKNRGPYPYDQPKRNAIPFTPKQVTAIRSAMNEVMAPAYRPYPPFSSTLVLVFAHHARRVVCRVSCHVRAVR